MVRSAGSSSYNFVDPVVRDVVSIGNSGDNVTIRFFTDNPGPWFFHCHIDWHLDASVVLPCIPTLLVLMWTVTVALPSSLLRMFLMCRVKTSRLVSYSFTFAFVMVAQEFGFGRCLV